MATVDVERDLRLLLGIQAVRAFLYGFGAVILGSSLAASGASDLRVGLVGAAILAGMALSAIVVGVVGDRVGRRRAYAALLILLGVVGLGYALTDRTWVLVVLALFGTMSTDANENGPLTTLEQAMIGQAPAGTRVRVFGRYNAVAYLTGALGALAAGGPAFLHRIWAGAPTARLWFLLFPLGAIICLWLSTRLSTAMELEVRGAAPLVRSRERVFRLASLFAIDAFAGGFVVTVFIVFWFEKRFGASVELMSAVIFASGLLQAGSSIVAARVGARFGLLNTMVFTHLPSNILLMCVPLMPTLPMAIAVLLVRFALSQMDVPTRQAYLAALVDPEERTAAAATTNTARYLARPLGPIVGTALMRNVALGAPWVVAGALKAGYDVTLWRVFKRVELPS
jgi:predicted MFS family arabinose efflux permease